MKKTDKEKTAKEISSEELDRKFDAGEDITEYIDESTVRVKPPARRMISVDMPRWMIKELDEEAARIGVTRQSIIKMFLAEKLKKAS